MDKNTHIVAPLVRGAFAAALCLVAALSSFAKTPEEVSRERRYPARYCADDSTPEARAALIAELWKHDPAADTKLWPEGKVPMKANDKPIRMMEHELWQRNLVVSDSHVPFFSNGERDRLHPSAAGHERIAEAVSLAVGGMLE